MQRLERDRSTGHSTESATFSQQSALQRPAMPRGTMREIQRPEWSSEILIRLWWAVYVRQQTSAVRSVHRTQSPKSQS